MPKVITSTSREFVWPRPDVNVLRAAVAGTIARFVPEARFHGNVTTNGVNASRISYDAIDEWLIGLTSEVDDTYASFSDRDRTKDFTFSWRPREATVNLSVEMPKAEPDGPSAASVIDALAVELQLITKSEQSAERVFTPAGEQLKWVEPAVALARELTGTAARFRGRWDEADTRRDVQVEGEWLTAIRTSPNWEGDWRGQGKTVRLAYQKRYDEVRIELGAYDQASMTDMLDRVTLLPGLEPRSLEPRLQGEARRYFLAEEATLAWYTKAHDLIRAFAQTSFWGRVAREGEERTQRGYGNADEWWAALQHGLAAGDVATSFVSYSSYTRRIQFELDHVRHTLSIDLQSIGGNEVAETHQLLAKELALTIAPPDAYRYRRWGQTFDIEWDSNEAFADGLESGLRTLFNGSRVVLPQATLHMGGGEEEVQSFRTLSSFLKYLRDDAKNLTEVHLLAEGPRGEFIGVHVDKRLSRLRLLASTTTFKAFRTFQKSMKNGLKSMEPGQESLQESAAPPSAEPAKGGGWVLSVVLALLTLAGVLLGTELYKAIRESSKLQILLPPSKDGEYQTSSPVVRVRWIYVTPQVFGRETVDGDHPTSVEVTRVPDGSPVMPRGRHNGSIELPPLAPGSYSVLLIAEGASTSLIVKIVPSPASPP